MLRRVSSGLVGALVLAGIALIPATAGGAATTVAPIKGKITCGIAGTMTIKDALPSASSLTGALKKLNVKVSGKINTCDNSGVTGGKMPITGGTFTASGTLDPGSSCNDISGGYPVDFTFNKTKIDIKWTGTDGSRTPTVAHSKSIVAYTGDTIFGGWEYFTDYFPAKATSAFGDEAARLDMILTNPAAVNSCTNPNGNASLSSVSFTSTLGSSITVDPSF